VAAPTAIVAPGEVASLTGLLGERGWERFVLKPVVSATAFGTARFTGDEIEAASAHLEGLLERGPALVQRYEPAIEREGERSIMVIGGEATHCVVKRPVAGDFRCQSDFGGSVESAPLTAGDAALALRAVAAAPIAPSYARVDVIDAPDGARLMELELIEPELFFLLSEVAVHRMVDEVMRRARSPERKLGDTRTTAPCARDDLGALDQPRGVRLRRASAPRPSSPNTAPAPGAGTALKCRSSNLARLVLMNSTRPIGTSLA